MILKRIRERVKKIKEEKNDFKNAHSMEDSLYEDFVLCIAVEGTREQKILARAVLKTKLISFARRCAENE